MKVTTLRSAQPAEDHDEREYRKRDRLHLGRINDYAFPRREESHVAQPMYGDDMWGGKSFVD